MDWTVVLSVILALFLFNVLKGLSVIFIGFIRMRAQRIGEIDTTKKRSTLG